ncbi:MAG: HAD-IB family hydrolase [Thermoflexibacteraceae bacterium]|jgi:phosphatidylglycerophosphatase C
MVALGERHSDTIQTATRTTKTLVLFDFDGTLTAKETLPEFIAYVYQGSKKYIKALLGLPFWLLHKLGFISHQQAKRQLIKLYLANKPADWLEDVSLHFTYEKLPELLKTNALERLAWHLSQGHEVVVVSASMSLWLKEWCEQRNIRLIATELEVKNGFYTGRLATKSCTGKEKVRRIKSTLPLQEYSYIYAYGDSKGDKAMLDLAHEKYYKYF